MTFNGNVWLDRQLNGAFKDSLVTWITSVLANCRQLRAMFSFLVSRNELIKMNHATEHYNILFYAGHPTWRRQSFSMTVTFLTTHFLNMRNYTKTHLVTLRVERNATWQLYRSYVNKPRACGLLRNGTCPDDAPECSFPQTFNGFVKVGTASHWTVTGCKRIALINCEQVLWELSPVLKINIF